METPASGLSAGLGARMGRMSDDSSSAGCEIGLGSVVAVILSAALNHSFWWGLLHFVFGWIYVLYAVLFRTKEIVPALKAMFT